MERLMERLEAQIEKLEVKLDKIDERLNRIDITLARLTDTVEIHEKRSTTAEAHLALLDAETKKVADHVKMVNILYRACVIIGSGVLGVLIALKKLELF